jgi:hypothetical protein
VSNLPPTSSVFAAFLGYNPIKNLLGPSGVLSHLSHARVAFLTGRSFFPSLITGPFRHGLHEALDFAASCCLLAALAASTMGKQYFYKAPEAALVANTPPTPPIVDAVTIEGEQSHREDDVTPVDAKL